MPKSCKYKTYYEGYVDGFNRCIEMIEKLKLSLVSNDSLEKMKEIDFDLVNEYLPKRSKS